MRLCRIVPLIVIPVILQACGSPQGAPLEENKALARQFFQDIDESRGSLDFIDTWMTADFETHFNSQKAMDLAGYRQFMSVALAAFSDMRHEIHYMVAENDLVAVGVTLHMTHNGEFEGIAATGRSIAVEEIVIVRLRDGKISEEWIVLDFGALLRQLEPTATAPE